MMAKLRSVAAIAISAGIAIVSTFPAAGQTALTIGIAPPAPFGANQGFDAELAALIADMAELEVVIRRLPADDLVPALTVGDIDVAIGAVGQLDGGNATEIAFTQTAVLNTGAIIVGTASTGRFTSLADLQGHTVGVQENSTWQQQLIDAGVTDIRPIPDFSSGMALLLASGIDAYYTSRPVFLYAQQAAGLYCDARIVEAFINTAFPLSSLAVRAEDSASAPSPQSGAVGSAERRCPLGRNVPLSP